MIRIYWVYDYDLAKIYDEGYKKLCLLIEQNYIDYLQLRCKNDQRQNWVKEVISKLPTLNKTKLIINDDILLAKKVQADGVHIGNEDLSPQEARKILGNNKIIGVTARSLLDVKKLQDKNIDYLGVGTVFKTQTKKGLQPHGVDFIKDVAKLSQLDFFPIGGIDSTNVKKLVNIGVQQVAIAGCLFRATNCLQEVEKIRMILENDNR